MVLGMALLMLMLLLLTLLTLLILLLLLLLLLLLMMMMMTLAVSVLVARSWSLFIRQRRRRECWRRQEILWRVAVAVTVTVTVTLALALALAQTLTRVLLAFSLCLLARNVHFLGSSYRARCVSEHPRSSRLRRRRWRELGLLRCSRRRWGPRRRLFRRLVLPIVETVHARF